MGASTREGRREGERAPCHHNLEQALEEWLSKTGLAAEPAVSLFPTMRHGSLTGRHPMAQAEIYQMIRRRATVAGLGTKVSCHSFRATGITVHLQNGGKLEVAQQMAGHESARTTGPAIAGTMRWRLTVF